MNEKVGDWSDRRVWVIGASSGIGAETVRILLAKGARVALSARRSDRLHALAGNHRNARVAPLDVTDAGSLLSARDGLLGAWGGLDLVLVMAGTYSDMRVDTFDIAIANHLIDMNMRGTFNCLNAVLPVLLKQGNGSIGIVASVAGYSGLPRALIYGPTKAALINLAESLYLDLRPRGIGVHLINPGFVETRLTAGNDFDMPALISATEAAHKLLREIERGKFHIHFPRRFTNWMRFARLLPYSWYFLLVHKVTGL
jgi:NAD(P)-dependent dehydrogenase (short-subunit alcohol dehydrogenase family)